MAIIITEMDKFKVGGKENKLLHDSMIKKT